MTNSLSHYWLVLSEAAQLVNDWSGHLWLCIQDLLGTWDFVLVVACFQPSGVVHLPDISSHDIPAICVASFGSPQALPTNNIGAPQVESTLVEHNPTSDNRENDIPKQVRDREESNYNYSGKSDAIDLLGGQESNQFRDP